MSSKQSYVGGSACHTSRGVLGRSVWWSGGIKKITLFVAAFTVLFLAAGMIERPASGASASYSSSNKCGSSHRLSHTDSNCIHAWWDNSPSISTGVAGGYTMGVRSFCSQYGDIRVHVDIKNGNDWTVRLTNGSKFRFSDLALDVRSVSCCRNKSDLCYKNEVEPNSMGSIAIRTGGSDYTIKSVNTHLERYEVCTEFPDSVYCENDPEGDAFVEPVSDEACLTAWETSSASQSCQNTTITTFTNEYAVQCRINTECRTYTGGRVYRDNTKNHWLSAMHNLVNCSGTLTARSCP